MLSVRLIDLDNVPDSGTGPGAEGIGPGIEPDIGAMCGGAFGTAAYGFPNMFGGCTAARGESPPGPAGGAIIIGGGGCDPRCELKCVAAAACCSCGTSRRRGESGCGACPGFCAGIRGGGGPFHLLLLCLLLLFFDPPSNTLTTRMSVSVRMRGGPKMVALTAKLMRSLFDASAVPNMESTFTARDVRVSEHRSMNDRSLLPCLDFHTCLSMASIAFEAISMQNMTNGRINCHTLSTADVKLSPVNDSTERGSKF